MQCRNLFLMLIAGMVICSLMVGCNTVRRVDYGEASESALREARPSSDVPQWALGNVMGDPTLDHDANAFFIGISQEQATSEYEAVQQAYFDAMRRVSDALSVRMSGFDRNEASEEAGVLAGRLFLLTRLGLLVLGRLFGLFVHRLDF